MAVIHARKSGTSITSEPQVGTNAFTPKTPAAHRSSKATEAGDNFNAKTPTIPKTEDEVDEEESNQSATFDAVPIEMHSGLIQKGIVRRCEIAAELSRLSKKLMDTRDSLKRMADLQVLRREMSRAHISLREFRSERDYVSVISTVEQAIQNINWSQVTNHKLQQIHDSLSVGLRPSAVTFDDVNVQARQLRGHGISSLPTFDLLDVGDEFEEGDEADSTIEQL